LFGVDLCFIGIGGCTATADCTSCINTNEQSILPGSQYTDASSHADLEITSNEMDSSYLSIPLCSPTITESPPTITEFPPTITESPLTITASPSTITESQLTITEYPSTITDSPPTITGSPLTITESPLDSQTITTSTYTQATVDDNVLSLSAENLLPAMTTYKLVGDNLDKNVHP